MELMMVLQELPVHLPQNLVHVIMVAVLEHGLHGLIVTAVVSNIQAMWLSFLNQVMERHVHLPMVQFKTDQDVVQPIVHGPLGLLVLVLSPVRLLETAPLSLMVLKSILVPELVRKEHVIQMLLKIKLFLVQLFVEWIVIGRLGLPTPRAALHVVEVLYSELGAKTLH